MLDLNLLICSGNQLTSLDVSKNTVLESIGCGSNKITSLDVSKNSDLRSLNCEINQLTNLDVSNNTALEGLYCSINQLTSLDVLNNTALTYLGCGYNQLTSLDVSNNKSLRYLLCNRNQITNLDISNNTSLVNLDLSYMPTLYEVCVWEMPFPPAGVEVDTDGSPNVYFTTDCVTNIPSEYTANSTIDIYPNPSDDIINIEIENINNATIEIYNISGRLVFSKALNSRIEKIDISGLLEGMYFVKVRQENNVGIEKLIIY